MTEQQKQHLQTIVSDTNKMHQLLNSKPVPSALIENLKDQIKMINGIYMMGIRQGELHKGEVTK